MTPQEGGDKRLEMLLESALRQVCSTITTRMVEPSPEMQARLREQIRVALFAAKVLGKLSKRPVVQNPTLELDTKNWSAKKPT